MPPTPAAPLEFVSEPLLGTYPTLPQDMALSPYGSWYPVPEFLGEVPPQWQDYIARLEEENRYLRGMLQQYLPPPGLPQGPPCEPKPGPPMSPMSPSAAPFCPPWRSEIPGSLGCLSSETGAVAAAAAAEALA
ncbi:unnamed protein product [Effrenium voratum]|uniref:Uncharacterized protein n=1 Tax=Effrenium voratum TaxID=2562239 RepID=A0AA36J421_9DINO|nr:unnamed protein product [Effrenium voratum]